MCCYNCLNNIPVIILATPRAKATLYLYLFNSCESYLELVRVVQEKQIATNVTYMLPPHLPPSLSTSLPPSLPLNHTVDITQSRMTMSQLLGVTHLLDCILNGSARLPFHLLVCCWESLPLQRLALSCRFSPAPRYTPAGVQAPAQGCLG